MNLPDNHIFMGNTALQQQQQLCAHQRKFVLDDRPAIVLATIDAARHSLPGHDEDDIISLIEEGFLAFGWNIALREKDAAREVRIFPDCMAWYSRSLGNGSYERTTDDVLAALLKQNGDKPFIRGSVLRLILNCSSTHLIRLVDAKLLSLLPDTDYGRGPSGTPMVTVASVRSFLKARRMQ